MLCIEHVVCLWHHRTSAMQGAYMKGTILLNSEHTDNPKMVLVPTTFSLHVILVLRSNHIQLCIVSAIHSTLVNRYILALDP